MKKLLILAFVGVFALALSGCKSDNTNENSNQNLNTKTAANLNQNTNTKTSANSNANLNLNQNTNMSATNTTKASEKATVVIETSLGNIEVELDGKNAPISTANFLSYVNDKFYDGTIFHRVIGNFMIQGGGFDADMNEKQTKLPIKNEAKNGLKNDKYTIAMARTQVIDSATSQFFINVVNNDSLNYTSDSITGYGYAVFGKVVAGTDVVDKIKAVATTTVEKEIEYNGQKVKVPYEDVPKETVKIVRVYQK